MGLLDNQTQNDYYRLSTGGFGDYQFTTMDNIISAFMITHVGEDKIISKVKRSDVGFLLKELCKNYHLTRSNLVNLKK